MKKITALVVSLLLFCLSTTLIGCNIRGNSKQNTTSTDPSGGEDTSKIEHTHAWGEWATVKDATCTDGGTSLRTCACGEKEEQLIPAKGHTEVIDSAKEPTCTETGLTEGKKCFDCGLIFIEQAVIPKLEHHYVGNYCTMCGEAADVSEGQGLSFTDLGDSYSVSGIGTCTDTEIVIPATYHGKPVTEIGASAFADCSSLTSIAIPDSVTSIGAWAFDGCSSLTSITIPDSVTSIGENAFYGCSSLTSITYKGTKAQWESIVKGSNWNMDMNNYTIYCTDGNISPTAF